ncbi:NAD(P)/FAD-dependent oxidoreductase [Streptomyces antarcticus]|uniref:NAD(P)/FAD-dependent oxidoreductase n=1 Tax=Streptomyces antarcticus TaxID=2996458 RepID=UPI00226F08E7|nr:MULTISPECIES: FAD-dependent oxidoreductase [unclassified Streptomyces]MCY0939862.1 FAD-dependent oxidoreductase [Streptomyces sp. H34-AA3]MCY0949957.1 FAD-dependent oxidoreductase [Streptomyces sp. H27-S2]MCZ4081032.1 FAD-dependent oxidoreductase [Streptomyces sp. H34-S5]
MSTSLTPPRSIVIVGASLAGLRTAEALRTAGFAGSLTIVGDEPYLPYDRPPLSKDVLTAQDPAQFTALPLPDGLDARWQLGRPAVRLDPRARTVTLADGTRLPYDAVVIATGSTARTWPARRPPLPRGVFTLRGWQDAVALRAELAPGRKLAVIGAGFLGGEVAAAARARGLDVTLIESAAQPLERAVGTVAGGFVATMHREAGIDLRTHTTVSGFLATDDGRITGVRLSDHSELPVDAAVLALGAVPATGWLADSGLALEGGVHCDAYLRALLPDGTAVPGVVAAGDVTRVPHPLAGGAPVTLGHWTNAVEQAASAAHTLLHPDEPEPFSGIPSFWSDLHGARIRSVGLPGLADEARIAEHELVGERRLEVSYHKEGHLIGALTIGRTRRLAAYQRELQALGGAASPLAS